MSTFAERLEIMDSLDGDGWFVFYRAIDRELDREVVVCRLSSELVVSSSQVMERFHGRLAILRGSEFGVAETIFDGGVEEEGPLFLTNFPQGEPLGDFTGTLTQAQFKELSQGLCEALVEIHAKGVAHGCLTSDVVRLGGSDRMQVHLGGLMRTVFAEAAEDSAGRSMRACDLAQLAVILAEALGWELDEIGGLVASDPNASFMQQLLLAGLEGGFADAEGALGAAQALPSEAIAVAVPPPPPPPPPARPPASQSASQSARTDVPGVSLQAGAVHPVGGRRGVPARAPQAMPPGVPLVKVHYPKQNQTAKYVFGAFGLILLAVIGLFVVSKVAKGNAQEKKDRMMTLVTQRFEAAGLGEEFPISGEELDAVLSGLTDESRSSQHATHFRILQFASSPQSDFVNAKIREASLSEGGSDLVRSQLFSVLKLRKAEIEVSAMLEWASKFGGGQPESLRTAGELMEPHLASRDMRDLLRMVESSSVELGSFATALLEAYMKGNPDDRKLIAEEIAKRFETSVGSKSRNSYLKLLIATGSERAWEVMKNAMGGSDSSLRVVAYELVKQWPDDRMVPFLVEQIEEDPTAQHRTQIFWALISVAGGEREREDVEREKAWKAVAATASGEKEKVLILQNLGKRTDEWALDIVEYFKSDAVDRVSERAEATYEGMEMKRQNIER